MKLHIDWLGDLYINKRIDIPDELVSSHTGHWAMNELYMQDFYKLRDKVVFHQRTEADLKHIPKTSCSSMALSVFSAQNFVWYSVDREYIESALGVSY